MADRASKSRPPPPLPQVKVWIRHCLHRDTGDHDDRKGGQRRKSTGGLFHFLAQKGKGRTIQRLSVSSWNTEIAVSVGIASEAG